MKIALIWKKLLVEDRRFVTSEELRDLANELDKNEWNSVAYLQRHGYIVRILRGIFYVRNADERERNGLDLSIYELVAKALDFKEVGRWYFGLESGLKFNNMTHEYFNIEYVITEYFRTTKIIKILDSNFQFVMRAGGHFSCGISKRGKIRYSDPEKTVLDLAYKWYLKDKESKYFLSPIREYHEIVDIDKMSRYLEYYPRRFRELVGEHL